MTQQHSSTNKYLLYTTLAVALLAALALSVESYMQLQGTSLCQTSACEVVGKYLQISEQILVAAGAGFFWILTILFFFAHRYPKQIGIYPFLILAVAMAFDGGLIGFQFFTIKQKCFLCLATASVLILVTFLYCIARKKTLIFFTCLLAWIGGFSANGIIDMPDPSGAYKQMAFYQRTAEQNEQHPAIKKTFVFSMECPHCMEIIKELAEKNPKHTTWRLAAIDRDAVSLMKISKFMDLAAQSDNPFSLLTQIKKESIEQYSVNKSIKTKNKKTLSFLNNFNINSVPVLIVETSETERKLLIGSTAIQKTLSAKPTPIESNMNESQSRR